MSTPPTSHSNCRFQEQTENTVDQTNFDQLLTDKLTICTLNIKMYSDRGKLKEFLQDLSQEDSIVCLQEFSDNRDLMELLDHLRETKSKLTYCGRSSHGHCAVLSTLPLQEVGNLCKVNTCLSCYPQVVKDDDPKYNQFVTVKVQGLLVTCVHLPSSEGGEATRVKCLRNIWTELEKKGLWKEGCVKHIFAGDFNSLTEEDEDEEGWERVRRERGARNMKLDEAISLGEKKQGLVKGQRLRKDKENNWVRTADVKSLVDMKVDKMMDRKAKLDKVTAQLNTSLQALDIKDRGNPSQLNWYLKRKKLEELKFDLTKVMEENGFRDSWREVEKMEYGQIGSHATSK